MNKKTKEYLNKIVKQSKSLTNNAIASILFYLNSETYKIKDEKRII